MTDHPQLTFDGREERPQAPEERHEAMALFTPAPAPIPGQAVLGPYVDPRLSDRGLSWEQRSRLAAQAGLISADHPQIWKDSDLQRAAARASAR